MKPVFSMLTAALLTLATPQLAEACQGNTPLSRQDVAFADVIFEGSIKKATYKPRYIELTFDVHNVVRGDLPHDEINIGFGNNFYFDSGNIPIDDLIETLGATTRVAISTPYMAEIFCKLRTEIGKIQDSETGEFVMGEAVVPICDSPATSLVSIAREKVPFVLSNDVRCGSHYLYSAQRYEKMRDYDKNLAVFEKAVEEGLKSSRELFLERVGHEGGLPWNHLYLESEHIVGTLFAEHPGFFTPELRTNLAWQASLIDFGVAMAREESLVHKVKFRNDEAFLLEYRESLKSEILKLLDYMDKDPEFRTRLLQAD